MLHQLSPGDARLRERPAEGGEGATVSTQLATKAPPTYRPMRMVRVRSSQRTMRAASWCRWSAIQLHFRTVVGTAELG